MGHVVSLSGFKFQLSYLRPGHSWANYLTSLGKRAPFYEEENSAYRIQF